MKCFHGLMRATLPLALLFGSASGRVGAGPTGSDSHRVLLNVAAEEGTTTQL